MSQSSNREYEAYSIVFWRENIIVRGLSRVKGGHRDVERHLRYQHLQAFTSLGLKGKDEERTINRTLQELELRNGATWHKLKACNEAASRRLAVHKWGRSTLPSSLLMEPSFGQRKGTWVMKSRSEPQENMAEKSGKWTRLWVQMESNGNVESG